MSAPVVLSDVTSREWLSAADPRLKIAWLFWVSTLSVLCDSTWALLVLFVSTLLPTAGLKMRSASWLVLGGLLLLVAWGTLLSQAVFYARLPRTELFTLIPPADVAGWHFPGVRFYREGTTYGLIQSLRMLSVMLAGLCVCLSTSPERLLAALVRLRVPVAVSFMTVAALRFLPTVLSELFTVRRARRLRGFRSELSGWGMLWPASWIRSAGAELQTLVPVLAASLRRASSLATSVTSRGFDPAARRTYYPPLEFRSVERIALAVLGITWLAAVTAKLLYWLYVGELYYQPQLRWLYDAVRQWL